MGGATGGAAGGREREAGKPMTARLQWWHWSRKTAGLPWIPAAAGELGRSQRERPGSAARTQTEGKGGGAGAKAVKDAAADGRAKCASTRAAACWAIMCRLDGCRPGPA